MKECVPKAIALSAAMIVTSASDAAVSCWGKINDVYKWNYMNTISVRIVLADGSITPFVNMPAKSDEAMALMALASAQQVEVYWSATDVNVCSNGWSHNRSLEGYIRVMGS